MGEQLSGTAAEFDPEGVGMGRIEVFRSAEGKVLLLGIGLAVGFVLWVFAGSPLSGEKGPALAGLAVTEIIAGRAATMALGYSLGMGDVTVIAMSILLETILVLLFYPLFVFSWQHLVEVRWMKRWFGYVHGAAEAHKDKVQRYGILGLFVFVWLPFWMTGPAVGCVIGFLLGLRAWVNMAVVLGGTYIAIFGWAFLLKRFHEQAAAYNNYAALIVVVAVVAVLAIGRYLRRRGKRS